MSQESNMRVVMRLSTAPVHWQVVTDRVMGGISTGILRTGPGDAGIRFEGGLSLEQGGGFSSIRSLPMPLGLGLDDRLRVRLRGDGRTYSLNVYVQPSPMAFSYRFHVATSAEWGSVEIPLREMVATSFGREQPQLGPMNASQAVAVGWMLSDKSPGAFWLEVSQIEVVREFAPRSES
ncbi:CIA30 family protein [Tuwongella immobilis]|uniref:NADH:ubiquinone oxidoreductase intermediate-associated protein 30 domain-containing protein n=1 Tax=Tuwongella immobilis TaxID=692036 RepID=A0A6C2YRD3_9BACT|nr:CIA30 family protein [Tuwongella immobilis]VIP04046.1 NADH:ubiquinone oxidoreductase complex I intermediate-associated protein 30 OS=Rhodopirellula europaea 6C GN=RE6C_01447 PE=4 SV=1: CIA30 [Tuwongella immobilis]VTS05459.1 NADH:ubiquinone oxidoreductase complex I intermediate-associated protein 30 OS=Rhodopirellula europaea 6C GN=RE6C_01447 PE=4 SV=1: CIA30 [Tuwongella immobilis]